MKLLTGGLTFVNAAAISALLLGSIFGGLGMQTAALSFEFALVIAITAAVQTRDRPRAPLLPNERWCFWLIAAAFAFFAFRSFCWLVFIDGNQLKVQSPNNLGDLALHLTYIKNFALGVPLWPENPIHFASRMRYPAGTDLFNALLALVNIDVIHGLIWAGLLGSLATFYALYRWGGSFTVAGFLFNGGVVGLQIFQTWKFLDYQDDKTIAWKSLPLTMLVTQRGLLYALPAGLLLLCQWRAKYVAAAEETGERRAPLPLWVEISLYASMPLFHLHTFIALSLVAAWLFVIGQGPARKGLLVVVGSALLPATFFVWTITDHFQARSLLEWKPGWVQHTGDFASPFVIFWIRNFGLWPFFVLGLLGFVLWQNRGLDRLRRHPALAFLAPATLLFLVACLVKTAPWEWDNIKIIIWAYLIMLPFLWSELLGRLPPAVRISCCFVLFASGFVSLFGGLLGNRSGYGLAERAEVDGAGMALRRLPAEARFAAQPDYNHPLLLNGRKVALGYLGHVWTQGFDYTRPLQQLNALLDGQPGWRENARALQSRYLFWGREEVKNHPASTRPWEKETRLVARGPWGAVYDLEADPQAAGEESE